MVIGTPTVLNLIPGKVFPVVNVNQYDAGYGKTFLLYKGTEPFNIAANMSVTIRGTKGDKNGITDSAAHTVGNNLIMVMLTEQMTAVAGPNIYELRVVDTDGLLVGTVNFIMMVEPAALGDGTVISDSDLNYAADVLDKLQSVEAFKNQLDAATEDIAQEVQDRINAVNEEASARRAAIDDIYDIIDDGIEVKYHHIEKTGDTSWIMVKIPRGTYKLDFHNCSGDDTDSPTTLKSDPFKYLSEHLTADITTNCNFGGADYPGRLGGVNYSGTVFTRKLFAYNSQQEAFRIYPSGTQIASVENAYDVVFAIGDVLVDNYNTGSYTELEQQEPRNVFGWNDNYYYILLTEGRGNMETGLTLPECQNLMMEFGAQYAVNFDGGGSVCLAANILGSAQKINKFRDFAREFSKLRKVGLCAVYTRR